MPITDLPLLASTVLISGWLALGPGSHRSSTHAQPLARRVAIKSGKAPPGSDFFGGEFDDDDGGDSSDDDADTAEESGAARDRSKEEASTASTAASQQLRGGGRPPPDAAGYFHGAAAAVVGAIAGATIAVSCWMVVRSKPGGVAAATSTA